MIRVTCYKAKSEAGTHTKAVEQEYSEYKTLAEAFKAIKSHNCGHEIKLK